MLVHHAMTKLSGGTIVGLEVSLKLALHRDAGN